MWDLLIDNQAVLRDGVLTTLGVSFLAIALGAPLGLLLATASRQSHALVRQSARVYVSFWRGTPILVQLLLIFYLLPAVGINLPPALAAVVALACDTAAFQSEIYRAGLAAVPVGDVEAAQMLGIKRFRCFVHIEIPQAARTVIPPIFGQTIILIKESAVLSVITIAELTKAASELATLSFSVQPFIVAALLYWALVEVIAQLGFAVERHHHIGGH